MRGEADKPRCVDTWLAGCPRVRGNPRTGKLHGFESSNIEQRRCAEGDREAVSRRRQALLASIVRPSEISARPWRPSARKVVLRVLL